MKTADQILHEYLHTFAIQHRPDIVAAMKAYAQQACKEQREMCVNSYLNGGHDFVEDAILNAPQPQLV